MLDSLGTSSLDEMLDTVNSYNNGTNSLSVTKNNLKIDLQINNPTTDVFFIPSYNGVDYPNRLIISFNKAGDLAAFSDTSNLYKVGDTRLKVNKDEAINTAWNQATNITSVSIVGVGNVAIQFMKYPLVTLIGSVRGNMTAYALYDIKFLTDKEYYSTDGIEIGVWADNGQVAYWNFVGQTPSGQILPNTTIQPSAVSNLSLPHQEPQVINANLALVVIGITITSAVLAGLTITLKKRKH